VRGPRIPRRRVEWGYIRSTGPERVVAFQYQSLSPEFSVLGLVVPARDCEGVEHVLRIFAVEAIQVQQRAV
jgi:hypothetical protein